MDQQGLRAEQSTTGPLGHWPQVFAETVMEVLPFSPQRELRILLLQGWNSQLADTLARRYLQAQLTQVDIDFSLPSCHSDACSAALLSQEENLRRHLRRGSFDLVVANLLLFRFPRQQKRLVFQDISRILEPGGWLIGCDLVRAENPMAEKRSRQLQLNRWQNQGASEADFPTLQQHWLPDSREPLAAQLASLYQAGLLDVTCWFQHFTFAIYSACKPLT